MEQTRTLTSVTFDATLTSAYDYPAAFSTYTRDVNVASCSDIFTITIPTGSVPTTIAVTTTSSSVEYSGIAYVTSVETLSDGVTVRTISQEIPFDYTFPIATASILSIDVVSTIGTVLTSNILQSASTGNQIELEIQLSTPFPYQLAWVDQAPVTGPKFIGTDVQVPTQTVPLAYTVTAVSACGSTLQGATCVQTATINIDYSTGCSVDGNYALNFSVAGCNAAGDSTPTTECLIDNNLNVENIPVLVTISSLSMGDLCLVAEVFHGTASDITMYADSTYTTVKQKFIASDAAQSIIYMESTLTIGPDTPSLNAYTGFSIVEVARECTGVSTCTGAMVAFPTGDVVDSSTDSTTVKFSVPVADFTELTSTQSDIPYSIQLTVALLFDDTSKRSQIVRLRSTLGSVSAKSTGNLQFVTSSDSDVKSSATSTTPSSVAVAALCVAATAFLAVLIG
jgi:hypothetical protein